MMEIEALDKIFQQSLLIAKALSFLNKANEEENSAIVNDIIEIYHTEGGSGEFKGTYSNTLLKNKLVKLRRDYKDRIKGTTKVATGVPLDDIIEKIRKDYAFQMTLLQTKMKEINIKVVTCDDNIKDKEKEAPVMSKIVPSPEIMPIIINKEEVKKVYDENYLYEMEKLLVTKDQSIHDLREEMLKITNAKEVLEKENNEHKKIMNENSHELTKITKSRDKLKKQYDDLKEKHKKSRQEIEELKTEIEDINEEWESADEDDE